jgi:hypothetical protein
LVAVPGEKRRGMRASDGDGEALARVNGGFLRLTWLYI